MTVEEAMAGIKQDLKEYARNFCSAGARIAAQEFEKAAQQAIYAFYMDYSPKVYDRTGDIKNSFKKYLHNNGRYYSGGVEITSEGMSAYKSDPSSNYPYGTGNPSSIATGVWHGYRGPYANISGTNYEPLEFLKDLTIENSIGIDSICAKAREEAKKGNYKFITFS